MFELIGASIAAAFFAAGWLTGRRDRRLTRPSQEVCQCGHESSYHDKDGCHFVIVKGTVARYDRDGVPVSWEPADCTCVRYVGPLSSYVPELDAS